MTKSLDIAIFNPSDGLTPFQTKKLNQNFQRLTEVATGRDENSEATTRLVNIVKDTLYESVMEAAYPVGTILFAKDSDALPRWGKWRELEHVGRFIRIGQNYGDTGGSASQRITPKLPEHNHIYYNQIEDETVKVQPSTAANAKEVIATLKDDDFPHATEFTGETDPSFTVSTIPPFVTLRLFERYE